MREGTGGCGSNSPLWLHSLPFTLTNEKSSFHSCVAASCVINTMHVPRLIFDCHLLLMFYINSIMFSFSSVSVSFSLRTVYCSFLLRAVWYPCSLLNYLYYSHIYFKYLIKFYLVSSEHLSSLFLFALYLWLCRIIMILLNIFISEKV